MEVPAIKPPLRVILEKYHEDKLTIDEAELIINAMFKHEYYYQPVIPYTYRGSDFDIDTNKVTCDSIFTDNRDVKPNLNSNL